MYSLYSVFTAIVLLDTKQRPVLKDLLLVIIHVAHTYFEWLRQLLTKQF